ncbi:pre-mRNA-splicing regulator WTAP-like isoform X2 [Sipha flava]|uniref:Pre-mRNA-splicing regulator WTAP-like isoform X2 n=1 Tax=Sipha flava TaxID=143950 RepID=A0A2S2R525_9HEMI|nr:pre-mRNA-splicing regulator WTAP-like isoform X2 [Sipha flava]
MDDQHRSGSARIDVIDEENLVQFPRQHLIKLYKDAVARIRFLEAKANKVKICNNCNLICDNEREKRQIKKFKAREKYLQMKLAAKKKESKKYAAQILAIRDSIKSNSELSLKNSLQDPSTNILIKKLREELIIAKTKLEETQKELNASNFTPNSNIGKSLVTRCHKLHEENVELNKEITSGHIAKIECELALQKNLNKDFKESQRDLDTSADVTQNTILNLQTSLEGCKISPDNTVSGEINSRSVDDVKKYVVGTIINKNSISDNSITETSALLVTSKSKSVSDYMDKNLKHYNYLNENKSFQLAEGTDQSGIKRKLKKRKHKSHHYKKKKTTHEKDEKLGD